MTEAITNPTLTIVEPEPMVLRAPRVKDDVTNDTDNTDANEPKYDIISNIEYTQEDPSKTGPKPKKLVAVEVMGYEVGRGLRRKVVNPDDVYKLAAIGCNDKEIATWFDIDPETLRYNFKAIMLKGREDLKQALRHAMLKNAMNGNAALQIFLAKNMLGMSDNPTNSDDKQPLPWNDE